MVVKYQTHTKGHSLEAYNSYGNTALLSAVQGRQRGNVSLLLAQKADVQKPGRDMAGLTPLVLAAMESDGNAAITKVLLKAGADPSAKFNGTSALQLAEADGDHAVQALRAHTQAAAAQKLSI